MLAHFLALAVGIGSIALYLAAFFFPEIHRKNDFIWSGVGLFYALVLWVFSPRITGGLFLGHVASVALLGWLGWQTLQLRRQLTPEGQKTPAPSMEAVQNNIQEQFEKISLLEQLTQLFEKVTSTFSAKKAEIQQKQNVTTSSTESATLDKAAIDAIADADSAESVPEVKVEAPSQQTVSPEVKVEAPSQQTIIPEVKVEAPSQQTVSPEVQAGTTTPTEKAEVTSFETNVTTPTPEQTGKSITDEIKPENTEVKNEPEIVKTTEFKLGTLGDEEVDIYRAQVTINTPEEKGKTTIDEVKVENDPEIVDTTEFTIATPGGKEVVSPEAQVTKNAPEETEEIEEATFIQIEPENLSPEKKRPDYPQF